MPSSRLLSVLSLSLASSWFVSLPAQQGPQVSPSLFAEMRWRNIGPFRAGRTKAAAGHPSQPFTFYIGMVNGGVWKTTDAGRTWKPIFEDQPTGSIGWVVVAPSDPNIVYVGSGEGLPRPDLAVGDGIYKSTDAGRTWTHLGLRDTQQIPKIAVDPKDPNRLFVAALGHPYGPNQERGIFRSTDGGRTFDRVLFKDENTGGKDVDIDPSNPSIVYATLWEERQGPWENAAWDGTNGGLFKSTDGGTTWTQMKEGLPDGIVNAELAIAPSNSRRLYTTVEASGDGTGLYRSDNAGETWTRATTDQRPTSRINEVVPHVHPKDPDTLIVTDIVSYKSTDGGKTFVPFKGAPGGDDNQNIWWNPDNPDIMLALDAAAPATQMADAAALKRTAAEAMSARRFDDAAGIYRELLSSAPDDPAILVALGAALAQGRHPDQAVAPLEHAVQLNPGLMAAHALLGSSYLALGQYPKAVGSLERVVAAQPTDVEHRRMLAEAYGRSDRHADAVNELREVTTLAPKQPSGWYELGQAYNALAAKAMTIFADQPEDSAWRELLVADAMVAHGSNSTWGALSRWWTPSARSTPASCSTSHGRSSRSGCTRSRTPIPMPSGRGSRATISAWRPIPSFPGGPCAGSSSTRLAT